MAALRLLALENNIRNFSGYNTFPIEIRTRIEKHQIAELFGGDISQAIVFMHQLIDTLYCDVTKDKPKREFLFNL
jgi:hypothetical protein